MHFVAPEHSIAGTAHSQATDQLEAQGLALSLIEKVPLTETDSSWTIQQTIDKH
jgi:hypothetical protein